MTNAPKVIDLYSGVGGLSLSAANAGFNLIGAVEKEQRIIESHAINFPGTVHVCADLSTLAPKTFKETFKIKDDGLAGLIGGPPCQGFSSMGKRVLTDERNNLFSDFFKWVLRLRPAFYLAENVPGILDVQYGDIRRNALKIVEKQYHTLEPIKVSANDFGAATTRTRILFIGVRKDIKGAELIPAALDKMKAKNLCTVSEALAGLPLNISEDWLDYSSSWRKIETSLNNKYLRNLNVIQDGIGDKLAIKRFEKELEVSSCFGTRHSTEVATRYRKLVPGQQDAISKSIKLKADGLCPTLRAGTDSSKGSFQAVRPIHYSQDRVITPREAARLQGFPDWFQFHTTKWHSFRQIGNSVCPVAGEKILSVIKSTLNM